MVCPAAPTEPKTHKANRKKQLFISQSPFRSHRLIPGLVRLYPIRSKPGTKPCLQNPFTCQYLSMAAGLNCTYLHIIIGPMPRPRNFSPAPCVTLARTIYGRLVNRSDPKGRL